MKTNWKKSVTNNRGLLLLSSIFVFLFSRGGLLKWEVVQKLAYDFEALLSA